MRKPLALLLACAAAAALSACGEKHDRLGPARLQRVTLMLDFFPNADHVGIYEAIAEGDFRRAGLDVHVVAPPDPASPLKLLDAGRVDFAISYEPDLLLARDKGPRLVSVAALVQRPLTSIVSIGSKAVHTPAQLRGKRVGDAGIPYQHAYLQTILAAAHVPAGSVRETNVGFDLVPAMLSGKVDATLGAYWNYEAIQLAQKHKRPAVIHVEQAGVPTYDELVVAARQSDLANRGDLVRRFVQALARGYEAARRDPGAAVANLVSANPDLDRRLQLASVRATLTSFFPAGGKPWGWQDPTLWNRFGDWMSRNRLLANPPLAANAMTDEFLAGQGG